MLNIKSKAQQILELAQEIKNIAINNLVEEDDFTNGEVGYEDLFKYLVGMIKWTYQRQRDYKDRSFLSAKAYAKEACSIKFALSRQSGHTTFALKLFHKFFKNPVFLTSNIEMLHNLGFSPDEPNVGSMLHIQNRKFAGKTYDAVIVDCSSFLSQKEVEAIYDTFSNNAYSQKNFIFLFLE